MFREFPAESKLFDALVGIKSRLIHSFENADARKILRICVRRCRMEILVIHR